VLDIDPDSRHLFELSQKEIPHFVVFTQSIFHHPHSITTIVVPIPEKRFGMIPQKPLTRMFPDPSKGRQWYQNVALRTPVSLHRKESSHMMLNPDSKADAPFL
jgi:hypothetical protein